MLHACSNSIVYDIMSAMILGLAMIREVSRLIIAYALWTCHSARAAAHGAFTSCGCSARSGSGCNRASLLVSVAC